MGHWSKLSLDLLNAIDDYLVLYADKVRIRSICMAWNSYLPKMPNHQVKQFPWLLHPLDNNSEASHALFNPIDEKLYAIYLPEVHGKIFKGSSYGWVASVEDINSSSPTDIYLINPITRARITLPPRTEFADVVQYRPDEVGEEFIVRMDYDNEPNDVHGYDSDAEGYVDEHIASLYIASLNLTTKIVLSSAPCDECAVVAIYGHALQLAWCRFNDKEWTHIYAGLCNFMDILFHKGKLYALTMFGKLFMFENIGTDLDTKVTEIALNVAMPKTRCAHLAECSDGSLIVVLRYLENDKIAPKRYMVRTIGFKVYKFDSLGSSWFEVNNIGDDILFLGLNSSRAIASRGLKGYKGNHIYFSDEDTNDSPNADENERFYSDVGVFNLKDRILESLPGLHNKAIWPRPIWINVD
ncbi:hypothetical protein LguiB_033134 [Lonicera macranthoides]